MTIYLRRYTLTAPVGCPTHQGVPVLPAEVPDISNPPTISSRLENQSTVLACFGSSDYRLQKETKLFGQMLDMFKKPLTEKLENELNEWNRELDLAKKNRCQPLDKIKLDEVLTGAVMLKRYTLYLTTQISELHPET